MFSDVQTPKVCMSDMYLCPLYMASSIPLRMLIYLSYKMLVSLYLFILKSNKVFPQPLSDIKSSSSIMNRFSSMSSSPIISSSKLESLCSSHMLSIPISLRLSYYSLPSAKSTTWEASYTLTRLLVGIGYSTLLPLLSLSCSMTSLKTDAYWIEILFIELLTALYCALCCYVEINCLCPC